ncbi:hypothetical protein [Legionella spiritensis]|uniref:hypothetical protein n=1 Tax=Legionella spiritensis TaxID=452 RepID=UPI000F6F5DE0|nr:hypothetical protein [Legionella spiritensis]VEG91135.1 Uncharacterised protein [Legionella spiritensis]
MKKELLEKLKKINPINENGVPTNQGNCQWCAIEGARVLLEGVEPREIPNFEGGSEPIEERIHPIHGSTYVNDKNPNVIFDAIDQLQTGELMLVSLESDDMDHAYIIYKDEENDVYLIDPDRQVFVQLQKPEDFLQSVKGWENVETINYLNGDVNSDFRSKAKVDVCVLNQEALEQYPLPEYGSEPSNVNRF